MGVRTETVEPKSIKGYEILERMAAGGFGVVYRAKQSSAFGREVAMKVILPKYANQPEFIRRFEAEAELISRLEHPHIIPLYDYWRDPNGAYLIMRYLRGGSVKDALENDGAYGLEAASQLLDQVALALDFAHRNNVIHRDIKPGNILLDEDGIAYVADFGIAKDLVKKDGNETAPESIVGSLDYISPEQARSEPVSARTDIYSLGVTLYEMIRGVHPFEGASTIEKLYKHLSDPLPEITALGDTVRDAINEVIQKATAKNPAERYSDVLSFAKAFREAANLDATEPVLQIIEQLTMREHEFLGHLADGLTIREIADAMFITVAGAKFHRKNAYKKLGVRTRVQAIIRARDLDLIDSDTTFDMAAYPRHADSSIVLPEPINPYKGLLAFQISDAQDFFGREKFVERLLSRMQTGGDFQRFLAIVGPSGSGKSSVVKAGLIPTLWRGGLEGSERWLIVDVLPGKHPLDRLEVALTRVANEQAENIYQHLQRDDRGLLRIADLILPHDSTELLIYIDQFEEVFTLCEDEDERLAFLNLLYTAVTTSRSRVRVVVTLRADYYDRPLHYQQFGEMLHNRIETILPLGAKDLERAIVGPTERVGIRFETGLVAQIVAEMTYQAAALPLLQYALTELFNQREERLLTHAAYQAIGGAVGALANRAEELYQGFDQKGRDISKQLFLRLVTLGEGAEDTRRRVAFSELLSLSDDVDLTEEIVDAFADCRLLALDHDEDTRKPTVEVAHEAILREWERLRQWLNDSRNDIREERNLAQKADEWLANQRNNGYLLREGQLERFQEWQNQTSMILTPLETEFISASIKQREIENKEEKERQIREKSQKQRSRNLLRALVAVFALATIISVGFGMFALSREQAAVEAQMTSEYNAEQARELALINGGQAAFVGGDMETGLALAVTANQVENPPTSAQTLLSQVAYEPGTIRRIDIHQVAYSIDISPDGKTALVGGAQDNTVTLWDLTTGEVIHVMKGHEAQALTVGISPDGKMGFSIAEDRTIILWDLETGEMLRRFGDDMILDNQALAAAFSPDGKTLLSNNGVLPMQSSPQEAKLILWDVATGTPIREFKGHTHVVGRLAISPDGKTALSGGWNEELILWDMEMGEVIRRREELNPASYRLTTDVAFRPDGQTALVLFGDTTAALIDLATLDTLQSYGETRPGVWGWQEFALSPDGQILYLSNGDFTGQALWDVDTGERIETMRGTRDSIGAAFSPDGEFLVVNQSSGAGLLLRSIEHGAEIQAFSFDSGMAIQDYDLSPDAQTLLVSVANEEGCELILFNLETGAEIRHFAMSDSPLNVIGCSTPFIVFVPNSQLVLSLANAGAEDVFEGVLWDISSGEILLRTPDLRGARIGFGSGRVAISSDGQTAFIALPGNGLDIIVWNLTTGELTHRFAPQYDPNILGATTFNTDAGTALSASVDRESVVYWDLSTGKTIREYVPPMPVLAGIIDPDAQNALLIGLGLNDMLLWDLETGEILSSWNAGEVIDGAFSPDGRYIVTVGERVSLWDTYTGEEIRRYTDTSGNLYYPTFLPDGQSFLVIDSSFSRPVIRQWRVDWGEDLLNWTLANRYVRDLTCTERDLYRIEPLCDLGN